MVGAGDWLDQNVTNIDSLPLSCCPDTAVCSVETDAYERGQRGCRDALSDFVSDNLLVVAAVGIAFIVGEVRVGGCACEGGRVGVCVCEGGRAEERKVMW